MYSKHTHTHTHTHTRTYRTHFLYKHTKKCGNAAPHTPTPTHDFFVHKSKKQKPLFCGDSTPLEPKRERFLRF